jgi:eukaryotic-like serine/threonine-protein kinase
MGMTPGTRIGPYEIRAVRVVPGLGELYDARDLEQQRDVAFRVLRVDLATAPDRQARFRQESHAAADLVHPNILAVHDIGIDGEAAYVVSEPMEGQTLSEVLEAGPLPAATVASYAADLAGGLAAAHEQGVVHRDLTPAHILVTAEEGAKVVGLGLAAASQKASALAGGALLGTLSYMSPEQLQGAIVDARSDMFTFGAILYEMLTGTRAFGGGTLDTISAVQEPEGLAPLAAELPAALTDIVGRCLKKDPASRISADEVVKALRYAETQPSPPTETPEPAVPVAPDARAVTRWGWRTVASVGAVGGAAVGLWLWLASATPDAPSSVPAATTQPTIAPSTVASDPADVPSDTAASRVVEPEGAATPAVAAASAAGPRLVWFDRTGAEVGTVGSPGDYGDVSLSPDGAQVAVSVRAPGGEAADIWVFDADSGAGTRITSDAADDIAPVWSADGGRMVLASSRGGSFDLYERSGDSAGTEGAMIEAMGDQVASDWSADGRYLIYSTDEPDVVAGGNLDLWARRMPNGRPFAYLRTVHAASHASFSPDGSRVAYVSLEGGRPDVYIAAFPNYDGRRRVSVGGGAWPRWSHAGDEVFYLTPDNQLMVATVDPASAALNVGESHGLFEVRSRLDRGYPYDVSADGTRVLVSLIGDGVAGAVEDTPR